MTEVVTVPVQSAPGQVDLAALADPDVVVAGGDQEAAPPRRSIAANVAALATSQVITWSMALLYTFLVPRMIGPENMGQLVVATSVTFITAVALTIMPRDYLVRELVARPEQGPRLMATALATRLAVIPLVFLAAFCYGQVAGLDSQAMKVMYLMAGATCAAMLAEPALAAFQATERMQYIAYTDVGNKTMQTFGAVVLVLAGFGVVAITAFGMWVAILALIVALLWLRRMMGFRARTLPLMPIFRSAWPYWFVSLFFIGYLWADGLMLGVLVPAEVVGWYGAATRLFTTMTFVATILATASLPRLVEAHGKSPDSMAATARAPLEWAVILGLPIGIGVASISADLVPLLYGDDYLGAVVPLAILTALGLPLMYMNILVNQLFIASGRPKVMGWLLAATGTFNVLMNLLLIPWTQQHWGNGGIGAAISLVAAELIQLMVGLRIVKEPVLIRSSLRRIGGAMVAALAMCAAVLASAELSLAVRILIGGAVYGAVCLLLRVPAQKDLDAARRRLARSKLATFVRRRVRKTKDHDGQHVVDVRHSDLDHAQSAASQVRGQSSSTTFTRPPGWARESQGGQSD